MTKITNSADIVRRIEAGEQAPELALEYGVSRQRIHQIWKATTGSNLPRVLRGPTCPDCNVIYNRRRVRAHRATAEHLAGLVALRARLFWLHATPLENGCWSWTGPRGNGGYGRYRKVYAHRISYSMVSGPIPASLEIDHLCRNRGCINPAHLEAVTPRTNILRGVGRGALNARKTHCNRGHLFDEANTATRVADNGRTNRSCRACRRRGQMAPEQLATARLSEARRSAARKAAAA